MQLKAMSRRFALSCAIALTAVAASAQQPSTAERLGQGIGNGAQQGWQALRDIYRGATGGGAPVAVDGAGRVVQVQAAPAPRQAPTARLCIGFGSEKDAWLRAMATNYTGLTNGRVTFDLASVGSFEGARAIYEQGGMVRSGSTTCRMHVWSPASSIFRNYAELRYRRFSNGQPLFAFEQPSLVRSPLVLLVFERRLPVLAAAMGMPTLTAAQLRDPNVQKQVTEKLTFEAIAKAMEAPVTPRFTLHFTDPMRSNSGFMGLFLAASEFAAQDLLSGDLDPDQFVSSNDDLWLKVRTLVSRTNPAGQTLLRGNFFQDSTGNLTRQFPTVPSAQMPALLTYEQNAVQLLESAQQFGENFVMLYPKVNLISDHPYYVLNTASQSERDAASGFLEYLKSETAQEQALSYGFRAAHRVTVTLENSPLFRAARQIGASFEIPSEIAQSIVAPEAIANIEEGWNRGVINVLCQNPQLANVANFAPMCNAAAGPAIRR